VAAPTNTEAFVAGGLSHFRVRATTQNLPAGSPVTVQVVAVGLNGQPLSTNIGAGGIANAALRLPKSIVVASDSSVLPGGRGSSIRSRPSQLAGNSNYLGDNFDYSV